jgi:hypothetical protein
MDTRHLGEIPIESLAGLDDWELIERLLPAGWQEAARHCGALTRLRKFKDAATLLRVMLMHLTEDCSLRETAVRANAGGLVELSDVAIWKHLCLCDEWFRWISQALCQRLSNEAPLPLADRPIRLIDGTTVLKPGAAGKAGQCWRVHYAIEASTLHCDEVDVTTDKEGESFTRFTVRENDVFIADRGYANRRGVRHVVDHGGDVIVRMNLVTIPLEDPSGHPLEILPCVRHLKELESVALMAQFRDKSGVIPVRVCVLKKTQEDTAHAQSQSRECARKKGKKLQASTLEGAGYMMVLTTLLALPCEQVLQCYRCRWQVELAFKRLKSLLGLGQLRKSHAESARAWIQGKLMVAFLIETLLALGEVSPPEPSVSRPAAGASQLLARNGGDGETTDSCHQSRLVVN